MKHLSTKIQEVTSNVGITKKNEKHLSEYSTTKYIPGTQGAFPGKVGPDIDDFTDEPEFQCDVQVVENAFVDDSK